mmetsp:Transcript_42110/g.127746  ORF Transcript_42110/g.127746 Transcript_42110/m.127746 type:complete len:268 (+) Transcript_42110:725-1528(+)
MLRRNVVADLDRLVNRVAQDREAVLEGLGGRAPVRLGERGQLLRDGAVDPLDERRVVREEDGPRGRVVLGLGDEVGRDHLGVRGLVGDDEHFGRAREHVDAAPAVHDGLGRRYPLVPRADDDVTGGDRLAAAAAVDAVRHGRHRLRPPDPEDDVRPGNVRRRHGDGRRAGTRQHDPPAPRRARSDGRHDDRRGEGVPSTRGVAPCRGARADGMSRLPARNIHLDVHHRPALGVGEGLDAIVDADKRGPVDVAQAVEGGLALLLRHRV